MKHLAAYFLLVLGGKAQPTKEDVEFLLKASGVSTDDKALTDLIKKFEGKLIHELIPQHFSLGSLQSSAQSSPP